MHNMYNYIPETNHLSRVYSVAAILYLQFVLHAMLFRPCNVLCVYITAFRSMYAMPDRAVFCSSLISCFPVMLLRYCLSDFEKFHSPLLLLVSLLLSHSTCDEFLLWDLYIFKSSQLLSWSQFCLQELQRLLKCVFLVYYHGLWCPVYC